MKRLSGVQLPFRKSTETMPIEPLPLPRKVRIPMLMHKGEPCVPCVHAGDPVTVGQCIGTAESDNAAPIHASVSGTVTEVTEITLTNGTTVPCVEIRSDREQILCPDCCPPMLETREDLITAVRNSGCVGLSGAGIPTHKKLSAAEDFDMLIVNGAECDPYLTADSRQMSEAPQEVIGGIELILRLMNIPEARIGIMADKFTALKAMTDACEDHGAIRVCPLPTLYPQGAEKVLVFHTCGRIIEENQTAADQKVLVLNVSTCAFLYQYSQNGIPLIDRVVTVSGNAVKHAGNIRVPIGTPVMDLLEYTSCDLEGMKMLLSGGIMMGECLTSLDYPVLRQQNGLIALRKRKVPVRTACIRCGACMKACPMNLMPMMLEDAYIRQDLEALRKYRVSLCINCGSCSYVCPAHRPLAASNQLSKAMLPKPAKGDAD